MVQMFIAMHREFQSSVRDELSRVQKLTKELSRLHARLLEVSEPAGSGPNPGPLRRDGKVPPLPREGRPAPKTSAPPRTSRRADAPTGAKPEGRRGEPDTSDRRASIPGNRESVGKAPMSGKESTDMYAEITRRITELQRERSGYWQRILKAING
jgi:hypothetical protein